MFVEHHVTAVCKAGLYHLRNISRIRRYISRHTAEILMLLLSPVWIFVTHYFQDGKGVYLTYTIAKKISLID